MAIPSSISHSVAAFGALLLVGCGIEPTPTQPPATPFPSPTPPLDLDPRCAWTEVYSPDPLVAIIGVDPVPTAFDAVNTGGCEFRFPITQIEVRLSDGANEQVAVIPLPAPVQTITFPLGWEYPLPLVSRDLPPGDYERAVTAATAVRGPRVELPGFTAVKLQLPSENIVADIADARSLWAQSGIDDYSYLIRWECFCPPSVNTPVEVVVRRGEVLSRSFVDPELSEDVPLPVLYGTIEDLFGHLELAIAEGAAFVTASFDRSLGYPVSGLIDHDLQIADEERSFRMLDFTPMRR